MPECKTATYVWPKSTDEKTFGWGSTVGVPTSVPDKLLLETGTDFYLLEDGTSRIELE